jgi:hypothetical protein
LQSSYANIYAAKYINPANCAASSCDWNGYATYIAFICSAYSTASYSCGEGGSVSFCFYSDERLKHGVETLKNSLETIMKLDAVEYDWNDNLRDYDYFKSQQKLHTIGLIAQNVRMYYPEVIKMNTDGYYTIDYSKLNAVLVEAIKEQSIFIEDIDKELDYIETKLS